jgi:hypothetical protein
MFRKTLKAKGWTEIAKLWEYAKGDWKIDFDTSDWMIVSNKNNPRVFDVHLPGDYESAWTVNLIEHLCRMEDERCRLRKALEGIRDDSASEQHARSAAKEALARCYHAWLVDVNIPEGQTGRVYCQICGQTGTSGLPLPH